jgi:hypothetical protein
MSLCFFLFVMTYNHVSACIFLLVCATGAAQPYTISVFNLTLVLAGPLDAIDVPITFEKYGPDVNMHYGAIVRNITWPNLDETVYMSLGPLPVELWPRAYPLDADTLSIIEFFADPPPFKAFSFNVWGYSGTFKTSAFFDSGYWYISDASGNPWSNFNQPAYGITFGAGLTTGTVVYTTNTTAVPLL